MRIEPRAQLHKPVKKNFYSSWGVHLHAVHPLPTPLCKFMGGQYTPREMASHLQAAFEQNLTT